MADAPVAPQFRAHRHLVGSANPPTGTPDLSHCRLDRLRGRVQSIEGDFRRADDIPPHLIQYIQHTNVKTPRWLGYIIVRPENHMLHHAREKHHSDYSDLPIVDMLFGTFENPIEPPAEFGFWDGASTRVVDHLLCRDNTSEPESSVAS